MRSSEFGVRSDYHGESAALSLRNPHSAIRTVMMGTGPFAVPTFRMLLEQPNQYPILALFTRPERSVHTHGKQQAPLNRMRAIAEERGVPVFDPESINSAEAQDQLKRLAADLLVVCDYGQILARDTLALARLGGINLHGSLLPKYRGAAPVNWAIYHGENETGVSVIQMTPRLDAGPCLVQKQTPIDPNETAVDVESRLAELGAPAVIEAIDMLASGQTTIGIPQDPKLATKAPRLKKTDGLVDWSRTAREIRNQVRAFQPWPKTYTFWRQSEGETVRLILDDVVATSEDVIKVMLAGDPRPAPGTAASVDKESLMILCGQGAILPQQVQPAGKRVMSISEFLQGHAVQVGDRFGIANGE